jgi:hypothetical protein
LPPVEFREPEDLWRLGMGASSDLDVILRAGVWPPQRISGLDAIKLGRGLDVWTVAPPLGRRTFLSTIWWWESRRLIFNGILLAAAIPTVSVLYLVCWIRVAVYHMYGGSGAFSPASDSELILAAFALINIAYTLLCVTEVAIRACSRPRTEFGLEMWQLCLVIGLIAVVACFAVALPHAVGAL